MIALWLLLACHREDPEFAAVRDAVASWEEGKAALDAGDPTAAREAFVRARQARPDDPLLATWEAKARADEGDLAGAIAVLDEVLAASPALAEARYNRAAYKARAGFPEEDVAADLERALAEGVLPPRDVLDDPDFAPVLSHPAFAFLPRQALTIGVDAPTATVFWGSEATVRFRITGAGAEPLALTAEVAEGPLVLLTVVDDAIPSTEGTLRDLSYTFRAVGEGKARFGPIHVSAGGRRVTVPPFEVRAAAPEGKKVPPADLPALDLRTPREVVGRADIPSARIVEGDLVVVHLPGDRVALDPEPSAVPVRYEERERGQSKWEAWRWHDVGPGTVQVRILRAGQALLDAPVANGAPAKGDRG